MKQRNSLTNRIMRVVQSVYRNAIPPEIARINRVCLDRWWDDLRAAPRAQEPLRLIRFGRKAFSQADEDGILLEIFRRIGMESRHFVEFGAQTGLECNCALFLADGWSGLWLEMEAESYQALRENHRDAIGDGRLTVLKAGVSAENINQLLAQGLGGRSEVDLLSIDIDGNDYWVWQALTVVRPRVVVIEYNATYPPPIEFVMPYAPTRMWDGSCYFGASLAALEKLGQRKGYALVGCSITGANAFFVREDALNAPDGTPRFHAPYTAEEHYEPPRYALAQLSTGHPSRIGANGAPAASDTRGEAPS